MERNEGSAEALAAAVLDHVLAAGELTSEVYFAGEPCGPWQIDTSGTGRASFHLVLDGTPWLHGPDAETAPRQLQSGDLVFLPRDAPHALTPSAAPPVDRETRMARADPAGTTPGAAALVCGRVALSATAARFLLAPLPELLVMPASGVPIAGSIVTAMWHEASGQRPPLGALLNKLSDVLVGLTLRHAVRTGVLASGLFAALGDVALRRALLAVTAAPAERWTVETLAARALLSRSAFAARFHALVGSAPLEFVRDWRMHVAVAALRAGRSVAEVAASVGYESEASFAKAFKRVIGAGPGTVRVREPRTDRQAARRSGQ